MCKNKECWVESGYNDFAEGTFGNGGQNIYVSRNGILQRIFTFDCNKDGFVDLVFFNSQDMDERPPVYVYDGKDISRADNKKEIKFEELSTQGAYAAAVCDINGDGYDDLVVANQNNGTHSDITAFIYYGSETGLSEKYRVELYAPNSRAVAIGDFNGDGKPDIAFSSDGKLKVFYQQEEGFIPNVFNEFQIEVTHMSAEDIDFDGYSDLYLRTADGRTLVFWGGAAGLDPDSSSIIGTCDTDESGLQGSTSGWMRFYEGWRPKILTIDNITYLYMQINNKAAFYRVDSGREAYLAFELDCRNAVSAAAGDLNNDGHDDIVLVVCSDHNIEENSYVYYNNGSGFSDSDKLTLWTNSARDAIIGDTNGNGHNDIVIIQGCNDIMYSTESLVYLGNENGIASESVRLKSHDATAGFIASTRKSKEKQIIIINHVAGRVRGDEPTYVYYGSENGFSEKNRDELSGWAPPDGLTCDFNDDGWTDLLICNCSENAPHLDPGSYIYWGGPDGFRQDKMSILPTFRAHGCATGDFRHTGFLDLAVVGFCNPEMLVFRGTENGLDFSNPQRLLFDTALKGYEPKKEFLSYDYLEGIENREPRFLLAADFNNDGWLDIFISQVFGQYCYILWGGPSGYSMDNSVKIAAEGSICAQAADLDGDGWLELIIGGHHCPTKKNPKESYIYIYWGGPDGYSNDRRSQLPGHGVNSLSIADFNNDGILDIFATSYNSGRYRDLDSFIYWGKPGGEYSATDCTRLFSHSASGCFAADFNEDGWMDIAVANHKTWGNHVGLSDIWINGPEGFLERNKIQLPTIGPHGMVRINPGNIADRSDEEYYISSAFKLPENAYVTGVSWKAELPPKTWVKCQLRSAVTKGELEDAVWSEVNCSNGTEGLNNNTQNTEIKQEKWIQYKLALGSTNGGNTPRISQVTIEYEIRED